MLKKIFLKVVKYIPLYREILLVIESLNRIHADLDTIRLMESDRIYAFEMENNPRYKDPLRLPRYMFQVNSQNGEDGILLEIFRRIGVQNRIFAEIGVGDGNQNNTAFLLSQGWKGCWIDGNDAFLQTIKRRRDLQGDCLRSRVSFVKKENAAELLAQLEVPRDLDLLSLDVDQNTYYVWEALHEFKPRVVLIEYNASIPAEIDWKVEYSANRIWDGSQNFGASLKAYEKLGSQLGYTLVGCDFTGTNAFFVRDELVMNRFAAPFTSENHFEPPRYGYIRWRGHRKNAILDRRDGDL